MTTTSHQLDTAGFTVTDSQVNDQYRFVSDRADNATQKDGVTSISMQGVMA